MKKLLTFTILALAVSAPMFAQHTPRVAAQNFASDFQTLPVVTTVRVRAFAPTMVYLIRRRRFWPSAAELERSAALSRRIGDEEMAREVSWLRSYAVRESDGTLGTVCLYQAVSPAALREHARRCAMPADEIVPVLGRIVYRDDATPSPALATRTEASS